MVASQELGFDSRCNSYLVAQTPPKGVVKKWRLMAVREQPSACQAVERTVGQDNPKRHNQGLTNQVHNLTFATWN